MRVHAPSRQQSLRHRSAAVSRPGATFQPNNPTARGAPCQCTCVAEQRPEHAAAARSSPQQSQQAEERRSPRRSSASSAAAPGQYSRLKHCSQIARCTHKLPCTATHAQQSCWPTRHTLSCTAACLRHGELLHGTLLAAGPEAVCGQRNSSAHAAVLWHPHTHTQAPRSTAGSHVATVTKQARGERLGGAKLRAYDVSRIDGGPSTPNGRQQHTHTHTNAHVEVAAATLYTRAAHRGCCCCLGGWQHCC
jgi:hypothetical protein